MNKQTGKREKIWENTRCGFCLPYFFLCLSPFFFVDSAASQSSERSNFFEKNFARNPLDSSQKITPPSRKSPTPVAPPKTAAPEKEKLGEESSTDSSVPSIADSPNHITQISKSTPRKVVTFGAVLNCHDHQHCKSEMQKLRGLVKTHGFLLSKIYLVGELTVDKIPIETTSGSENPENIVQQLDLLQSIQFVSAPPPHLAVNLSPAWIVETDVGTYVLEGVASVEKYFNGTGEFLAPHQSKP